MIKNGHFTSLLPVLWHMYEMHRKQTKRTLKKPSPLALKKIRLRQSTGTTNIPAVKNCPLLASFGILPTLDTSSEHCYLRKI